MTVQVMRGTASFTIAISLTAACQHTHRPHRVTLVRYLAGRIMTQWGLMLQQWRRG